MTGLSGKDCTYAECMESAEFMVKHHRRDEPLLSDRGSPVCHNHVLLAVTDGLDLMQEGGTVFGVTVALA